MDRMLRGDGVTTMSKSSTVTVRDMPVDLRAMLLGHSLTLQISGGEVVLGKWQRVLMAELDGPRTRTVRLQVLGIA